MSARCVPKVPFIVVYNLRSIFTYLDAWNIVKKNINGALGVCNIHIGFCII